MKRHYGSSNIFSNMRLLLIEDEKKVADFVARGLRAERLAVDIAYDGPTGWEMATAVDYDVIILDLMLPGLNGTELLRRLRRKGKADPRPSTAGQLRRRRRYPERAALYRGSFYGATKRS